MEKNPKVVVIKDTGDGFVVNLLKDAAMRIPKRIAPCARTPLRRLNGRQPHSGPDRNAGGCNRGDRC